MEELIKECPYELFIVDALNLKELQSKEVGYVKEKGSERIVAKIVLFDEYLKKRNNRTIFVELIKGICYIFTNAVFFKKIQERSKKELFLLYHELGHIYFKHLRNGDNYEKEREYRIDQIIKGKASDKELQADAFAADIIGISIAIEALKKLQTQRLERDYQQGVYKKTMSILAQREFAYRIAELQKKLNEKAKS